MASHITLPFEIRLKIYEVLLTEWIEEPAIWKGSPPGAGLFMVRVPVPAVLRAEAGEARSRLLKWLVKHKGISPAESAPTLRFSARNFDPQRDFMYLDSAETMNAISQAIQDISSGFNTGGTGSLGWMPRRIALREPTHYTKSLPQFLKSLELMPAVQELAFAFVELEHGELASIDSYPKKNAAAYTLEQIRDEDIEACRWKLRMSIEGLERLIRPMLGDHWHGKNLKITACKMIPRI